MTRSDARWPLPDPMAIALDIARDAARTGAVPVAAVIVRGNDIIATAHNAPAGTPDPTAHAEILAIRQACERLGQSRLEECDLHVTLEPCAMCAGAIVHARIARLYFGAHDPKGGAVANGARVFDQPQCLHRPEVYGGLGEGAAAALLKSFFAERR